MKLKVIVVEPRYQINLGYIARISKNFGIERLHFVNPRTRLRGSNAVMYSKHARDLLTGARVYSTFDNAVKDCSVVVGTTGVAEKARRGFRRLYSLEEGARKIKGMRLGKESVIGLAIGREGTGLSVDELERCDMVLHIAASPDYPVLNISHALAILLYALRPGDLAGTGDAIQRERPNRKELEFFFSMLESNLRKKRNIRNRKAVMNVFRRVVTEAQPSRQELHALITALK